MENCKDVESITKSAGILADAFGVPLATLLLILIGILGLMAFVVWQLKEGFTKRLSGADANLSSALAIAEANYQFAQRELQSANKRIEELKNHSEERDRQRDEEIKRLADNTKLLLFQHHKLSKRNAMMTVALEWYGKSLRKLEQRNPELTNLLSDSVNG